MDLSSDDIPNPFGLHAVDFGYDMPSYRVALAFLSDFAGGTDESRALEINGGSVALLRRWEGSDKFRRVLAKCRAAAKTEREAAERREKERAEEEAKQPDTVVSGQRFIPIEDMPIVRTPFLQNPSHGSFGE